MSVVMAELLISHQSVSYLHGRPKEMDEKVTDGGEFIKLPCSFLSHCSLSSLLNKPGLFLLSLRTEKTCVAAPLLLLP